MGSRLFSSFPEAHSFARELVLRTGRTPVVRPFGNNFQVSGTDVDDESHGISNSAVVISKGSDIFERLDPEALALALQELLDDSGAPHVHQSSHLRSRTDDTDGVSVDIPSVLSAIAEYVDCLAELHHVKSLEYAREMSCQLAEISERLAPFSLGLNAIQRAKVLAAKSKTLPSETVGQQDAKLATKMAQLNARAGICSCGGKIIVREGPYGYFFGCTNFPDCFRTRRLTPEEIEFLDSPRMS